MYLPTPFLQRSDAALTLASATSSAATASRFRPVPEACTTS